MSDEQRQANRESWSLTKWVKEWFYFTLSLINELLLHFLGQELLWISSRPSEAASIPVMGTKIIIHLSLLVLEETLTLYGRVIICAPFSRKNILKVWLRQKRPYDPIDGCKILLYNIMHPTLTAFKLINNSAIVQYLYYLYLWMKIQRIHLHPACIPAKIEKQVWAKLCRFWLANQKSVQSVIDQ